jgi:GNAT superfamily N-acetyltransferase
MEEVRMFREGDFVIELSRTELHNIRPLCAAGNDVVLQPCIEGNIGRVWANNIIGPTWAIAVAGDFCFLLGSIDNDSDDTLTRMLSENCRRKIIVTDEESWISLIRRQFGDRINRFKRFAFKNEPNIFDKKLLNGFISSVETEFQIVPIDESIYYKALEDEFTADFCSFFPSLEEFLEHGIGYVIMCNGEIISGASSYTYCKGSIEITIGTKVEYRRKGLAAACAARLILECLDRNIYPRWDAANKESVALAEKLGYNLDKEYEVYSIC